MINEDYLFLTGQILLTGEGSEPYPFSMPEDAFRGTARARPFVYVVGDEEVRVTILSRRDSAPGKGKREKKEAAGKRAGNIGRAMRTVYDLVKCNPWEYFVTQTVSKEQLDRYSLPGLIGAMSRGVADQNKRAAHRERPLRYLWVPEQHEDGAWHLHGVMSGFVPGDLRRNGNGYLEWGWSADRVGFFSLSRLRKRERAASYVRKYMTKSAGKLPKGVHAYYASQGLQRPQVLRPAADPAAIRQLTEFACRFGQHKVLGPWAETVTLQGDTARAFLDTFGGELEGADSSDECSIKLC